MVFLHRDGLISVSLDAEHEQAGEAGRAKEIGCDQSTSAEVEIVLEDGMTITGDINQMMPDGHRRLQDVLNLDTRFLVLWSGDRVHLINKRRIVRVSPLPERNEAADGAHR